jgi:hemolysin activation/secretion protein
MSFPPRLTCVLAVLFSVGITFNGRTAQAQPAGAPAGLVNSQAAVASQAGSRIIDRGRLDVSRPLPAAPSQPVPAAGRPTTGAPIAPDDRDITLTALRIEGGSVLSPAEIAAAWQAQRGQHLKVRDIYAIADRIGAAYARHGIALYQVQVPEQSFAGGVALLRITEGVVEGVTIDGDTKDADLSLLRAYAAHIVADRPLRQSTMERYILLMNDIAGLTVGSKFENAGGKPGEVRLALTVSRKRWEYGLGGNNQGQALLSRTSLDANVAVNSVLREGDRTQLVFGAPVTFGRYQFYGAVHREPIGTDGATLVLNAGYLVTQPGGTRVSGDAFTTGFRLTYPVIRAVKESLVTSAGFDILNSDNAVLGSTLSDERTRALRASAVYALQDDWDGVTSAGITASFGVDALGARRGSLSGGGPSFSKISASISREQTLPLTFILRLSAAGQVAPVHLPLSEQFSYGGSVFGRSFDAGAVLGDQGFEASAELAYPLPARWALPYTSGYEVFTYADYGRVYATRTLYQYATDHGSSAGFGARAKLLDKVTLDFTVARTLHTPQQAPGAHGWRGVFGIRGTF